VRWARPKIDHRPPQGDAADPGALQEVELVIGRGRIEHPHDVAARPLLIGEAAIAADRIEARHGVGLTRRGPGFVDGERLAALVVPVIGIIADRHGELAARHTARRARDRLLEPGERGDRTGLPAELMLVIGHQEHAIDDRGIALHIPAIVADRHGDGDDPAMLYEARLGLAQELAVIGLAGRAQLLDVEEGAAGMVGLEIAFQMIEQLLAQRRAAQQRLHAARIPHALHRVLHHRQNQRRVLGAVDDLAPGTSQSSSPIWRRSEAELDGSQGTWKPIATWVSSCTPRAGAPVRKRA